MKREERVQMLVDRVWNSGHANLHEAVKELAEVAERALSNPKAGSVLQGWVMDLSLREQGTLLTGVRGCDDEPKLWTSQGFSDSPGRRLTAYIRHCCLVPADPREVDITGAWFQSKPPNPFKPSEFGHLPQHWYAHAMHCLEIVAYRHPDMMVAEQAYKLYKAMVKNLHLTMETQQEMEQRLLEDRIASGNVVQ